jgi:hypothetical protein
VAAIINQQPLQEIKMNQQQKIKNAWKLCDKIDELQNLLWQRYYYEFLDLLAEEDFKNQEYIEDSQKPL